MMATSSFNILETSKMSVLSLEAADCKTWQIIK